MLSINTIKKGIVIDHIKPGTGYYVFNYLNLDKSESTVAFIMNAKSKRHGEKDMIKVENLTDLDFKALAFIDPNITVNIIEDEKVVRKVELSLPDEVEGVIQCKNPRCITSIEEMTHKFVLVDKEERKYKCYYCEQVYGEEIQ